MRIVGAHEEPYPVSVPESLALDNFAIVTEFLYYFLNF
jgi:hypothetical protein